MRVGILGGTGPAGKALAARLASAGIDVVIGSRSRERGESMCQELREKWPDRDLSLSGGENVDAANADLVVVATPWDAAATTAGTVADHLADKVVISMANALTRLGKEFVPRSEEHTSELQSRQYLVCRLLLEKKKQKK